RLQGRHRHRRGGRGRPAALRHSRDPDRVRAPRGAVLNTGFWRGVGVTHNNFVVESFIDELAAVSKQDPVAFRRALLRKSPRALTVLELAAKEAGWGKPVPRGRGRGVALLFSSWGTYLAQVAEVEVTGSSDVRVRRIVCAVDCGQVVNPDIVKAQIESGVVYGIS